MKKRHDAGAVERMLAATYRSRTPPEPSEQWHQGVMRAIRAQGAVPSILPLQLESRMFWRAAAVAAAVAAILAISSFWTLPSDARLALQSQQEDAVSAWLLQIGD
jgi:hypothetical protein